MQPAPPRWLASRRGAGRDNPGRTPPGAGRRVKGGQRSAGPTARGPGAWRQGGRGGGTSCARQIRCGVCCGRRPEQSAGIARYKMRPGLRAASFDQRVPLYFGRPFDTPADFHLPGGIERAPGRILWPGAAPHWARPRYRTPNLTAVYCWHFRLSPVCSWWVCRGRQPLPRDLSAGEGMLPAGSGGHVCPRNPPRAGIPHRHRYNCRAVAVAVAAAVAAVVSVAAAVAGAGGGRRCRGSIVVDDVVVIIVVVAAAVGSGGGGGKRTFVA